MDLSAEVWAVVPGFEGYEASSTGRVRSRKTGRVLRLVVHKFGYMVAAVFSNGKRYTRKVHRLVALAFLQNPGNKPEVNHLNGIKADNRVENLEWATRSENQIHRYRVLGVSSGAHAALLRCASLASSANTKLSHEAVRTIRATYVRGSRGGGSSTYLAKCFGVTKGCILHVAQGRTFVTVGGVS